MIYVTDSPIIPVGCYGTYLYRAASLAELIGVLCGQRGDWEMALTYPRSFDLIQRWTGIACHSYESPSLDFSGSLRLAHGDRALVIRYARRAVLGHVCDPDSMMRELLTFTVRTESDNWMDLEEWEIGSVAYLRDETAVATLIGDNTP